MIKKLFKTLSILSIGIFIGQNIDKNSYMKPVELFLNANNISTPNQSSSSNNSPTTNKSSANAKFSFAQILGIGTGINQQLIPDEQTHQKDLENMEKHLGITSKESLDNVQKHMDLINGHETTNNNEKTKPIELLKRLADQGSPNAQFILGLLYEYGFGVTKDRFQAIKYYKKAATQGDQKAKAKAESLEKATN